MRKIHFLILACLVAGLCSCAKEIVLFNGENLDGWVAVLKESEEEPAPEQPTFSVQDGLLHVTGTPYGYLRTEKAYSDFILIMEWRWTEGRADSGIFTLLQGEDKVWPTGVQLQMRESDFGYFFSGHPLKGVEGFRKPALVEEDPEKPDGEWNTAMIISKGGRLSALVNNVLVNEAECDVKEGYIGIQSEGGAMDFRNIRLVVVK